MENTLSVVDQAELIRKTTSAEYQRDDYKNLLNKIYAAWRNNDAAMLETLFYFNEDILTQKNETKP